MKVLFVNRPKNLWVGGDYIQLEETAKALTDLGVEVEISETPLISPAIRMREFDIVHTFNFSMLWSKYAIWAAKKWGKKTVASMIYHESDGFVPYDHQQIMLDNTDAALFQTKGEIERVKRHLTLSDKQPHLVLNGIDAWWLEKCDEDAPETNYVLTVGRIEETKGQLSAAKACKLLGVKYICIGDIIEKEYAERCTDAGAIIMPSMPQKDLKRWYYHAKAYIQPSAAETWGLAVDEAGSQGTPVVLTERCERDDYPFIRCKWHDKENIKEALEKALALPKDFAFAKTMKQRTWGKIAKDIKKIYEDILTSTK